MKIVRLGTTKQWTTKSQHNLHLTQHSPPSAFRPPPWLLPTHHRLSHAAPAAWCLSCTGRPPPMPFAPGRLLPTAHPPSSPFTLWHQPPPHRLLLTSPVTTLAGRRLFR
uniref:Uncharacterized protein n=1 Tax=Oryza brachyantha TaxID=4533 RepID=J3LRQ5_ORYBR